MLIDQYFLFFLDAPTQKSNKIFVLEFFNQLNFILELLFTLNRTLGESFYSYFQSLVQVSLETKQNLLVSFFIFLVFSFVIPEKKAVLHKLMN